MHKSNGKDDALELVLPRQSARVFREAGERALESGREVVYAESGVLYRRVNEVDEAVVIGHVEPPQPVKRGWKTTLR